MQDKRFQENAGIENIVSSTTNLPDYSFPKAATPRKRDQDHFVSRLAHRCNRKVDSARRGLRDFFYWATRSLGRSIWTKMGGEHPQHFIGEVEGITSSADSTLLSTSQNLPREGQESLGIGNGKDGERRGRQREVIENTMPFLHLSIRLEDPEAPDRKVIQKVLNGAKDWYRYAPNCWLIYTGLDAHTWAEKIRKIPGIEEHTSFLICETPVNDRTTRAGWLPRSVWNWINQKRSE
jgi:hypothetical protein